MRGAHGLHDRQHLAGGITPAHAGSTSRRSARGQPWPDHPRTCGEHTTTTFGDDERPGSPPHMRGAPAATHLGGVALGTTPAHAGSTQTPAEPDAFDDGSPPHMRGALLGRVSCDRCVGITPAHAGSTALDLMESEYERDHPRTCGEHSSCPIRASRPAGSPPHMRGARRDLLELVEVVGITPAHAGSTRTISTPCA